MSFDLSPILESIARAFGAASPALAVVAAPDGNHALALVREGYKVELLPGRTEPRPAHTFHDLASFAAWLNRFALHEPRCDILVDAALAVAHLNHSQLTAARVTCLLRHHPDYAAWNAALEKPLGISALHDLIRAVAPTFRPLTSQPNISQGEQILGQLSSLEVVGGTGLRVQIAHHGLVEFQGAEDKRTVSGVFPDRFVVDVAIYDDIYDSVEKPILVPLEILLSLRVVEGEPIFTLRAPRRIAVEREALRLAVVYLRSCLDDSFLVCLGAAGSVAVPVGPVVG